jgi:hypothetical protein
MQPPTGEMNKSFEALGRPTMKRRGFFITLCSTLASVRAAPPTQFTLGMGTFTLRALNLEEMTAALGHWDLRDIEMSRPDFMLHNGIPEPRRVEQCRRLFDRGGIRCLSYLPGGLRDERDLEASVRIALTLGAANISADNINVPLSLIDSRLRDTGLTFGIHNHWFKRKFKYESAEDVLQALDGLSERMGSTADTGHFASCGLDPVDALGKLRYRLKVVHLKDVERVGGEDGAVLGEGIARIPQVVEKLKEIGYRGLVAIEYEGAGHLVNNVTRCVMYARRLLASAAGIPAPGWSIEISKG